MAKRMREKALARKANADRRPQATAKYVRISPSKVRIVLNIIRGKSYNEAMAILQGTPKAASEILVKILASAGANAEFKNIAKDDLFVAEAFANEGPTYKRWWPRSHGSADQILKRTSHITLILDEKVVAPVAKKSAKAESVEKQETTVTTGIDVAETAKEEVKQDAAKAPAKKTNSKTTTTKTTSTKGGAK